jgi:membrane-associated phospholipid phosphatase
MADPHQSRSARLAAAVLVPRDTERTRRPGDLVRVGLASLGLLVASLFSTGNQISAAERHVFEFINTLSDAASPVLYTVMQAGTFAAVFVAAGLALVARRTRLALTLVAGGTAAWLLAKAVKWVIERDRPGELLPDVVFHGPEWLGLGYPSGHAAVAAAIMTLAGRYLTRPVRWAGWVVVWVAAMARVYTGAHLPLDVVGGLFLGWGVGSLVNLIAGTPAPTEASDLDRSGS